MKKKMWNNPELKNLKLTQTHTDGECTCAAAHGILTISNNTHFCHSLGEWHENGCQKTEGHYRDDKCDQVHWNGPHDSKCCCSQHTS